MLLAVYRNTEGVHFVGLYAIQRTLTGTKVWLKTVHLARNYHPVDNTLTLQPLTELLTIQPCVLHAEYGRPLSHTEPGQPFPQFLKPLLVIVYTDVAVLPVNILTIIIGYVKPMLRHVNPEIQFVTHLFPFECYFTKGTKRRTREDPNRLPLLKLSPKAVSAILNNLHT